MSRNCPKTAYPRTAGPGFTRGGRADLRNKAAQSCCLPDDARFCDFVGMELTDRWYEETLENFKGSRTEQDFLSILETREPNCRLGPPLFALARDFASVERVYFPSHVTDTTWT